MKKVLLVILGFVLLFVSGFLFQGDPVQLTDEQKTYIGNWKGEGITLNIGNNSYIDYKKQKGSTTTSVSGPIVEFNDNDFKIGIGFFKSTFVIDKKPYQEGNIWKMTIDGNDLSRVINNYELKIPELSELNKLTNDFFTLFNNSVYKDDYQLFYDGISKLWQTQTTVDELKQALYNIGEGKVDLNKRINSEIVYSKPPFIDNNNMLVLEGYYLGDTKMNFNLKFIYEYPEWKLAGFEFREEK